MGEHGEDELERMRETRRRVVVAADDERRAIERELHDRLQQHLVAFGVNLQLASQALENDPPAAKALIEQLGRDVQHAVDDAARLAQGIYPPLLHAGGLGAALRAAAVTAGVRASIEVPSNATYAPEVAAAVYWCCLAALESAVSEATVRVHEEKGAVSFEVDFDGSLSEQASERLADRVEALGGELTVEPRRVAGSL